MLFRTKQERFVDIRFIVITITVMMVGLLLVQLVNADDIVITFGTPLAEWPEMRATLDDFEREHPGVKVELIGFADVQDGGETLIVNALAGTLMDVFTIHNTSLLSARDHDIVAKLDPYFEQDPTVNVTDYVGIDLPIGGIYAIPLTVNYMVMAYNSYLYSTSGLALPPEKDWNIEDFQSDVLKLTQIYPGASDLDQYGFSGCSANLMWIEKLMLPFGATLFNEEGQPVVNSPEATEAFRFWQELFSYGLIPSFTLSRNEFNNGRVAMRIVDRVDVMRHVDSSPGFDWDLCFAPHKQGVEYRTIATGHYFAMNSKSQHPDVVWELLKWVTGMNGHTAFANRALMPGYIKAFPIYEQSWADKSRTHYVPKNIQLLVESSLHGFIPSVIGAKVDYAKVQATVEKWFNDLIVDQSVAPEPAMAMMQDELENSLYE